MSSSRDKAKKILSTVVEQFGIANGGPMHGFGMVQPKIPGEKPHYVLHLSRKPTHDEKVRFPTECEGFEVKYSVCPAI